MKKRLVTILLAFCLCGVAKAQDSLTAGDETLSGETTWVTIGEDVFRQLVATPGVLSHSYVGLKTFGERDGVVITRVPTADLEAVSAFVHTKVRRCPGFIAHGSQIEAKAALENLGKINLKALPVNLVIDQQTEVNAVIGSITETNIRATIDHLSTAYTNRYYQYASGQNAALWIRDLWAGYAGSRSDVSVTTYNHSWTQDSVVMTLTGTTFPDEIVVLGGHLDSIKSGGMTTGTIAPGADDNASGIATLSEVIRVLMESSHTPERTIKFMGYAAEEVGLRGSADIAAAHAAAGETVVGVMQLDMTAFQGSAEDIVLIDDFTNAELNAFVGDLLDEYQPFVAWTYSTCGYGCSDHASWTAEGYPASFPFEARMGQHNGAIHTSSDTIATFGGDATHAVAFGKLAVSFAIEAGNGGGGTPPPPPPPPPPTCAPVGASCSSAADCCSNKCKGKSGAKVCK